MTKTRIQDICAIDLHSHFGPPNRIEGYDVVRDRSVEHLLQNMQRANIAASVNSSWYAIVPAGNGHSVEGNRQCLADAEKYAGIYMWAVIDPLEPETFDQARTLMQHPKVLGLKIHPALHRYALMDYGDVIFSFAEELGAPVLGHSGCPGCLPAEYGHFANRYPGVVTIAAHLGSGPDFNYTLHVRAVQENRAGNLYIDTSSAASLWSDLIEYAVGEIGASHILFGTDSPGYFSPCQRTRIDQAYISDADKAAILRENALRLFPVLESCGVPQKRLDGQDGSW